MNSIIAPFGEPIEARPAVPTEEERIKERDAKKRVKDERRGKRMAVDGVETRSEDEVLGSMQEVREREEEVKGVQ